MAQSKFDTAVESHDPNHMLSFDVVVEKHVATIKQGNGDLSMHEAAFLAVANQDEPGVYSWVNNGHEVQLTVEYPQTDQG